MMNKICYPFSLCILLFLTHTIQAQEMFTNPVLGGDHPDPTVVRVGEDYYMTHSSFDYLPGLIIQHSRDLVNWEPIGPALTDSLGSVWAPDICMFKGRYYVYFTVSRGNDDFHNYVVFADSPYGPWSKPVDLHIGGWIDPCHVYDEASGKRWLFLSGGHRIRLTDDGLSTIGNLEKVYAGWQIPSEWIVEGFALEGPKIKKIGDYYYYLNAEGGTAGPATTHMVVVARSKSIDGPWDNSPSNPLVHTYSSSEKWWSKGHGSLIDTADGKWWIVYHAYDKERINQGRQTLLEPVQLTADGWLDAPTAAAIDGPIVIPVAKQSQQYVFSEQLANFRIGMEWKGLLDFRSSRFHVAGNSIAIQAQGKGIADASPLLFVAPDRNYEISARLSLEGASEAGLILYYNSNFFAGIGCSEQENVCWRRGERRSKGQHHLGSEFWLKLRFEDNCITGYLSKDGVQWSLQKWGIEVSGYNHNTLSGFLSLLPGIYCSGSGMVTVSNFAYKPIYQDK